MRHHLSSWQNTAVHQKVGQSEVADPVKSAKGTELGQGHQVQKPSERCGYSTDLAIVLLPGGECLCNTAAGGRGSACGPDVTQLLVHLQSR